MIVLVLLITASSSYVPITVGEKLSIKQSQEWAFYELDYSENTLEGYYRVKLNSGSDSSLILSINKGTPPVFSSDKSSIEADFVDFDAWKQKRTQSSISIPISYLESSLPIIIGVALEGSDSLVAYEITLENSSSALCPNDCSGHGVCKDLNCECFEGYINYDCSTRANIARSNDWITLEVQRGEVEYAYFHKDTEIVDLRFSWIGSNSEVFIDMKDRGLVELPSDYENFYAFSLGHNNEHQIRIKIGDYEDVYLSISNNSYSSLTISFKANSIYDSNSGLILTTIMMVVIIIFLAFIAYSIIKCRRIQRNSAITKHIPVEVRNRLPVVKYQEIKDCSETICIICLDEFGTDDRVKQLKCKHIFHAKCIDEWLRFNTQCCLCKQDCYEMNFDSFSTPRYHSVRRYTIDLS